MNVTIQGASPKEVRYVMRSFLRVAWSRAKSNDNLTQILHEIFKQCSGGYKNYNSFRHTVYRGRDSLNELAAAICKDSEYEILRDTAALICRRNPNARLKPTALDLCKMCGYDGTQANQFYQKVKKHFQRHPYSSPTNR